LRVPTAGEKQALWFLAIVALSGSGVRLWRSSAAPITATDSLALDAQIARVDSVRALNHAAARGRTRRLDAGPATRTPGDAARVASQDSSDTTPLDVDRATQDEIEGLPGIGPALAKRIVTYRDSVGSFGQVEALCQVSGIGPALVKRLRPLVTFTGPRRPVSDECGGASKRPPDSRRPRDSKPR